MAVDMSNVKQIMHNNKEVIKIEDSLGNVLWENKKGSTINIRIGSWQDISITQYFNKLQIPPMGEIRKYIASKIGVSMSQVKITNVQIDGSTLYWYNYNKDTDEHTPYLSFQSGAWNDTVYFGGGDTVSSTGLNPWSSGIVNLDGIDVNNNNYPTILYGFTYSNSTGSYSVFKSSDSSTTNKFCQNSPYFEVPTFTIVVTYETM